MKEEQHTMDNLQIIKNPIASRIIFIRGQYVMLDKDIARLYVMETRAINQAVKRNPIKFPERFVFQLTREETDLLASFISDSSMSQDVILNEDSDSMSQNVILKRGQNIKKCPLVFTEQGANMLATVLKGDMAAEISVRIMDAFYAMRNYLRENAPVLMRLSNLEQSHHQLMLQVQRVEETLDAFPKSEQIKTGVFFDNQMFDARVLLENLTKSAQNRIILVDDYIDAGILQLFHDMAPFAAIDCYVKSVRQTVTMQGDFVKFAAQYPQSHCQLHTFEKSHDRWLIVDDKVYHFGASLKDLGKRWFAFALIEDPMVCRHIINSLT